MMTTKKRMNRMPKVKTTKRNMTMKKTHLGKRMMMTWLLMPRKMLTKMVSYIVYSC